MQGQFSKTRFIYRRNTYAVVINLINIVLTIKIDKLLQTVNYISRQSVDGTKRFPSHLPMQHQAYSSSTSSSRSSLIVSILCSQRDAYSFPNKSLILGNQKVSQSNPTTLEKRGHTKETYQENVDGEAQSRSQENQMEYIDLLIPRHDCVHPLEHCARARYPEQPEDDRTT